MDTLSIIEGNSNMIIANWGLVIATMVLVLITFFYMRHTKRMADIMKQEFELRIAPFIVIDELRPTRGTNVREYHPAITNSGFLPVHIMKIILEGWPKGSPSRIFRKETKIDRQLGRNQSIEAGDFVIQLRKDDLSISAFEEGRDYDFNQFLDSSEGKIYFTYIDRNTKEQKTGDRYFEHL
jgi:hypothetical protein